MFRFIVQLFDMTCKPTLVTRPLSRSRVIIIRRRTESTHVSFADSGHVDMTTRLWKNGGNINLPEINRKLMTFILAFLAICWLLSSNSF